MSLSLSFLPISLLVFLFSCFLVFPFPANTWTYLRAIFDSAWRLTRCGYKTFRRSVPAKPKCAEGRAPRATQWARSAACSRPLGARFFDRTNDLFSRFSILPSSRLFQLNLVEKNLRKLLNKLFHNNHKLEQIEQKNFMKIDVLFSRSIILFPDFSQLFLSSLKTIRTKPIWSTPTEKAEIYLFPKLPVMDWKNTVRNFPQQQ